MKATSPAPETLSPEAKAWWGEVLEAYSLEPHHLRTLQLAGEAWDRIRGACASLEVNGLIYIDRFDQPKARPECAIARDNSVLFARLIRELGLDLDPPADVRIPRPGGRY